MAGIFSKTSLHQSVHLRSLITQITENEIVPLLQGCAENGGACMDILELIYALSLDFVTGFALGILAGSRFLSSERTLLLEWLHHFENLYTKEIDLLEEVPCLTKALQSCGPDPLPLESWLLTLCDRADPVVSRLTCGEDTDPADIPVVYAKLKEAAKGQGVNGDSHEERLQIASELIDQVCREVLGLVLGYTFHLLSQVPTLTPRLSDMQVITILDTCLCTHLGVQSFLRANLEPRLTGL
ncbi:hypothetical protein BJX68DRAFT_273699 [Aspergillus pseudodeflectus]|uniref:Uncharacterized protein n=1 Tax=Aspergillus pseudodeflectus TaxID=176178 RepID=A0ABR4J721_9EURO